MGTICIILPGLHAGGVENYVLRFLQYVREGDSVTVFVRSRHKGDLYELYRRTDASIHFQPIGHLNPFDWYKTYKFFVQQRFDAVCDVGGNFAGPTMLLAHLAGVPNRIAFFRRSSNAFKETTLRLAYNRWVNQLVKAHSTRILSNSQHALDFFFPKIKDDHRFGIIPNGVDYSAYQLDIDKPAARSTFELPTDRFIVGHIGRYDWSKNHETIFKVARMLKTSNCMVNFVFAGKGTDSEAFQERLKSHGIQDICVGLGLQDNLPMLYKAMDLFYFPSITEGQPNALIEAMMAGLPVLTSNIPPIQEMMPSEMKGLLLDPMNAGNASAEIVRCIEDPAYAEKFVVSADFLEQFDAERNFKRFREELIGAQESLIRT